ncbi:hypothetical protein AVEN_240776-1 [Araneus ventricosus]|uniref:Uncharacterized protein n=1 Tax=Araneus ventricosus TaxID=182803 RepID=A0A4Y2SRU9_ARAVE|nr:hypothetical protein AVEN_240776-1 [Araneus ventricosus]
MGICKVQKWMEKFGDIASSRSDGHATANIDGVLIPTFDFTMYLLNKLILLRSTIAEDLGLEVSKCLDSSPQQVLFNSALSDLRLNQQDQR